MKTRNRAGFGGGSPGDSDGVWTRAMAVKRRGHTPNVTDIPDGYTPLPGPDSDDSTTPPHL